MLKSTTTPTKLSKQSKLQWKPHAYQKKALRFVLQNSCAGLLLDPGLGKTGISLAAIKMLIKEKIIDHALVIAPLRPCYLVWPKEIEKWEDFKDLTYTILHGKDKEKNFEKDSNIYIINPEGLSWLTSHKNFKKKFRGQALFVDESSKFKATNTKRFKTLRNVLDQFARRYILTGSFAPNGLLDVFGQVFILDLGNALGRFITHYRSQFFYPSGFGGYEWELQQGAEKRIQERIRPLTMRLDAEDHLELPKLIVNPVYIDLDENAQEIYDEMEKELIADLESGSVVAANAAVSSSKCAQIANGGIYDSEGNSHHIHNLKAEAVADIVDELNGTPALIAYEYKHDLERLRNVLGKNVPYVGGGISPARTIEIESAWNRGELPVLLGHPASIAHGLNLQNAGNHVIWHSLTWNFEHYDQFIRRIRRQGSTHSKVFVHHIIARDTVDEIKLHALNRKFRTQKDLFDALNTYLKNKTKCFTSVEKSAKVLSVKTNLNSGENKMSKFAKKDTEAKVAKRIEDGDDEATVKSKVGRASKAHQESESKPAKPKKAEKKVSKEKASSEPDKRKITLLVKENPKREGTKAAKKWDLYKGCKTVQDYLDAGGALKTISYDQKKNLIKVA